MAHPTLSFTAFNIKSSRTNTPTRFINITLWSWDQTQRLRGSQPSLKMESFDEMQIRHKKEQKDLQSRVMQKKKNASKKTRKGVNSECEDLERQLKERQEQERASLTGDSVLNGDTVPELDEPTLEVKSDEVNSIAQSLEKTSISEGTLSEEGQPRKRNRQKERLARRVAEQEVSVEEAKKEAANQPDQKAVERELMLKEFASRGLIEKSIRPDGHCLFSAVADQLSQIGTPLGAESDVKEDQQYKVVRKTAARYIEGHPDDFEAWLDEPLGQYVEKIRGTAEWGGHLELLALAKAYNIQICVLQDGGAQTIEPGLDGASEPGKIWLAYYRHGFGLGEHYNSLRKSP
jgi:OTU domain-containing protein 6